ncbi:aminotransferase class III-fold pyridoxal phosphate-dependent enzyme [Candidatus Hakubella thermalkaliphila]|uniref:Glutamate-1-semialdehyde 2,1-aminomutase n=4 Tax=Candidatus Hakubella thermalkaliphila TaxID=2754717 RepID=A0A6V8QDB7_9ACTN|nr:aminotransferase class III-fold pyridoxal phosphate-dependent enzyme [Candidatus Hakubella thermalkaliphila]MBT9166722.1 Aminopentol aminotransferase [Bacillota bacterium]MBT9174116.1 Aminopentol aminotransferase [Bacillota bacterium]GFP26983.1 glutamate-1-semialdehyde 2,1-aminomutase [Candidatus Hakubella thermalkaliphila]GFP42752.1 glutamate-1-semialdehyde 2,1-aminomutase [Candidatus Hakubella thermalkaliphila]
MSEAGDKLYSFEHSMELFSEAAKVIPGAIYGHVSPTLQVPGFFPYYTARAEGCRYWDIDGNEFIDYMCAYGPMILGYNYRPVEEAAAAQRALANCTNHPAPVMIELAEYLVDTVPTADWALFAKNGGDMTTFAVLVARAHTNRKKVVTVRGHYHGVAPWCTAIGHGGNTPEDHLNNLQVEWNDLEGFATLVRSHPDEIAAFIAMPYHHVTFDHQVMPAPGYWEGVEKICRTEGIVLISDDVRTGFRLHLGGSNEYFGYKPDLITFSKAMGNGYSISACVGRKELKNAAAKVFYTGSFWFSAEPMAAALATLKALQETSAVEKIYRIGKMLMNGLEELGSRYGLEITTSGHPGLPFMRFDEDPDLYMQQIFCAEVTRRGSFFHPHHNWFISAAHTEADINETLNHAEAALKAVKRQLNGVSGRRAII